MVDDWFYKSTLQKDVVTELKDYILPMLSDAKWSGCHPSQAPGSEWCFLSLPTSLISRLETAAGYKIYPDFYVWNYKEIKTLKIHKDTNVPGEAREIVGVIPLIGDFETQVYDDNNLTAPIASCKYGPGDLLFLNNTKYFHGGRVLSETRISVHFYFDFYNSNNDSLATLLKKHRITR